VDEQPRKPDELLQRASELQTLIKNLESAVREKGSVSAEAMIAGRALQTFCHQFGMGIVIHIRGETIQYILYPRKEEPNTANIFSEATFQAFLKNHSISS